MLSRVLSLGHVSVIAHRGGSKLRPENTLAAFDHAVSLGVDALECDVHLSRDGEAVVIHDATLDRTTDARGPVGGLTAEELARLDAGFHFRPTDGHPCRGQGHGVPRLRDLLARHPATPVVVEIKGDAPEAVRPVLSVLDDTAAASRVILGSFSQPVLDEVRRLAPDLVTSASRREARQALTRSHFGLRPRPTAMRLFQMPFRLRGRQRFGRTFVRAARRANLPVQAWVVDDADDMRLLVGWGVTGLISDRPDVAVKTVREFPT
jgi:glycerophosphoryl diester phosphodiesterase